MGGSLHPPATLGFASLRARFAQDLAAMTVAKRPLLGFASLRARFARLRRHDALAREAAALPATASASRSRR